jgi:hypothetical protein
MATAVAADSVGLQVQAAAICITHITMKFFIDRLALQQEGSQQLLRQQHHSISKQQVKPTAGHV